MRAGELAKVLAAVPPETIVLTYFTDSEGGRFKEMSSAHVEHVCEGDVALTKQEGHLRQTAEAGAYVVVYFP